MTSKAAECSTPSLSEDTAKLFDSWLDAHIEKRSLLDLAHHSADAVVPASPTLAPELKPAFAERLIEMPVPDRPNWPSIPSWSQGDKVRRLSMARQGLRWVHRPSLLRRWRFLGMRPMPSTATKPSVYANLPLRRGVD